MAKYFRGTVKCHDEIRVGTVQRLPHCVLAREDARARLGQRGGASVVVEVLPVSGSKGSVSVKVAISASTPRNSTGFSLSGARGARKFIIRSHGGAWPFTFTFMSENMLSTP